MMIFSCERARKWCRRAAIDGVIDGKPNQYHAADLDWIWMDGETPYSFQRMKEHFPVFREA